MNPPIGALYVLPQQPFGFSCVTKGNRNSSLQSLYSPIQVDVSSNNHWHQEVIHDHFGNAGLNLQPGIARVGLTHHGSPSACPAPLCAASWPLLSRMSYPHNSCSARDEFC